MHFSQSQNEWTGIHGPLRRSSRSDQLIGWSSIIHAAWRLLRTGCFMNPCIFSGENIIPWYRSIYLDLFLFWFLSLKYSQYNILLQVEKILSLLKIGYFFLLSLAFLYSFSIMMSTLFRIHWRFMLVTIVADVNKFNWS